MTRVIFTGSRSKCFSYCAFSIHEIHLWDDPAAIKLIITSFDAELEFLRPNSLPIWSYPHKIMTRVGHVQNDLLTPFRLRAETFRMNSEWFTESNLWRMMMTHGGDSWKWVMKVLLTYFKNIEAIFELRNFDRSKSGSKRSWWKSRIFSKLPNKALLISGLFLVPTLYHHLVTVSRVVMCHVKR